MRESHLEKVQKTLEKNGLADTLTMFGIDTDRLSKILDISIKELVQKYNPFETIFTDKEFEDSLIDTMTWMKDRPNIFYPRLKNNPINKVIEYIIEITIDDFHSKLMNFNTEDWKIPETPKLLYLRYGDWVKNNKVFKRLYSQYNTDKEEMSEYARTLKNTRRQGSGLRFSKSAIKANPNIFRPYSREQVDERTKDKKITCKCGWSWKLKDGGNDPYTCHKCGNDNSKKELTEKCWKGYTQKGMKTMFGKQYPNCVKKTNIKEEISTKSTNKEFNKYKDSKFHSLREYTFQDIVNNWDELSNHKNHNIKTIKFFVENPDEITELTYDEKGLEDGYHRLIASKILNKPRVKYTMLKEDANKKLSAYQKLVDNVVTDLKYKCETQDSESEIIITFDACDFIETLTEVKVVDITRDNTIQLSIKYDYIRYHDEDEFVYELKKGMKKYGNFKIEVIDSINTRNRQW